MKVLIVRVGAMGDVLHALPAVTALRRAQPDWKIDWVVDPRWSPLLVNDEGRGPVVGRVYLAGDGCGRGETGVGDGDVDCDAAIHWPTEEGTARGEVRCGRRYAGDAAVGGAGRVCESGSICGICRPARGSGGTTVPRQSVPRQGYACGGAGCWRCSRRRRGWICQLRHLSELPREEWAENWAVEEVLRRVRCACWLQAMEAGGRQTVAGGGGSASWQRYCGGEGSMWW